MDIALLFILILINGLLAMSEISVVTSRKIRLQRLSEDGSPGAKSALLLHSEPSMFLSTIQVGITTVGILSGAIGETALADPLAAWLSHFHQIEAYARPVALTIVVVGLTYFSVVVGELVPKQLGLMAPETIASLMAPPMNMLTRVAKPLVLLLSASSALMLRIIGARKKEEPPITNEEIKVLMKQGAAAGVFHQSEQKIVSNVLRLDEQRIVAIMTPRTEIYAIDLDEPEEKIRQGIMDSPYTRIVIYKESLDNILGIVSTVDLLKGLLNGKPLDLKQALHPALFVPNNVTTTQMLDNFRIAPLHFALLVDEYGDLVGLVTLTDVLTSIVGHLPSLGTVDDQDVVARENGSWLIDGSVTIERLKSVLNIDESLDGEDDHNFNTLGGFVMHMIGRIPVEADYFENAGWRFEVVDMDKTRVDKVLITRSSEVPNDE